MRLPNASMLLFALVVGGLTAGPAVAVVGPPGIPAPLNCTIPAVVPLVGTDAFGNPDPRGEFKVRVRDFANNPMAGSLVIVEFSQCSAARIAATGYAAGITVDCRPTRMTVRRLTDALGEAVFRIPGTARPGLTQGTDCVTISADGIALGRAGAVCADLNGADGVGIADLSSWLTAFSAGRCLARRLRRRPRRRHQRPVAVARYLWRRRIARDAAQFLSLGQGASPAAAAPSGRRFRHRPFRPKTRGTGRASHPFGPVAPARAEGIESRGRQTP